MEEWQKHHIWCNYFMRPAKDCKMCKGLREKYPEKGLAPDELLNKHFPKAKMVK
jgi:hypothetical protein